MQFNINEVGEELDGGLIAALCVGATFGLLFYSGGACLCSLINRFVGTARAVNHIENSLFCGSTKELGYLFGTMARRCLEVAKLLWCNQQTWFVTK